MNDTEQHFGARLHLGGYSDDLTVVALEGRGRITNHCGNLEDVGRYFMEEFGTTGATVKVVDEDANTVGTYRVEYGRKGGIDGWGVTIDIPKNATISVVPDGGFDDE